MFTPLLTTAVFLGYMASLFIVARWAERRAARGIGPGNNPIVYALSLAIYCTSWTFYGSVGKAATSGLLFLAIYLGPTVAVFLWWTVLRKMVRIKQLRRITSIADFISARYDRSHSLAAWVTIMALVGTLPYLALQLKAVTSTFAMMTTSAGAPGTFLGRHINVLVVGAMAVVTILFGVRRLDPTERHDGIVMALVVESVVKLLAFLAAGIFVTYFMYDGFGDLFQRLGESQYHNLLVVGDEGSSGYVMWTTYLVLSMSAVLFLPRQFHVAVVENADEDHIRTAMWLFPLYLFLMNLFVLPIAIGGLVGGNAISDADTFVLGLPLQHGPAWLALLVFLGGASSATGMTMVSTMTLSTMVTNHLLLPLLDRVRGLSFLRKRLLLCRWGVVVATLALAYWFERHVGDTYILANIGMISFAAALQFAPAILGGMFWRRANKSGARWGLTAGFAVWAYTLLLPAFVRSGWLPAGLLERGPWGVAFLRPEQLFGSSRADHLSHAVFWSMLFNVGLFFVGSLVSVQSEDEQGLAAEFINALPPKRMLRSMMSVGEPYVDLSEKRRAVLSLLDRYLPSGESAQVLQDCMHAVGIESPRPISIIELAELYTEVEMRLSGVIGAAAAHTAVEQGIPLTDRESTELTEAYGRLLARLRVPAHELRMAIGHYMERDAMLTRQAEELAATVRERDAEISRRKQAEAQLSFQAMLLDQTQDLITATDLDGRITYVNQAECRVFGLPREELIGRHIERYGDGVDRGVTQQQILERTLEEGEWRGEVINRVADGRELLLLFRTQLIYDDEGRPVGVLGVSTDITEQRQMELQLLQQERLAAVGQLSAGIAHDFNNILAAIVLYTQLLLRDMALTPVMRQRLQVIEAQSGHAADLVQQILDFGRRSMIERRPLDLDIHLQQITALLTRTLPENIRIETEVGPGRHVINADPARLQQAVLNLALNARDAMPDGGTLRIAVSAVEDQLIDCVDCGRVSQGAWVALTVADTGVGMSSEVLTHVFEPFFTTKGPLGHGLGLPQVYGIVTQHDGHLEVKSMPGEGTTFTLYWPALHSLEPLPVASPMPPVASGAGQTILIAEDNHMIRAALTEVLETLGYHVLTAGDGVEALAVYEQHATEIALVLSDWVMPSMGGLDFVRELDKRQAAVKVLMLTGYPLAEEVQRSMPARVAGWLLKPPNLEKLSEAVRNALSETG